MAWKACLTPPLLELLPAPGTKGLFDRTVHPATCHETVHLMTVTKGKYYAFDAVWLKGDVTEDNLQRRFLRNTALQW